MLPPGLCCAPMIRAVALSALAFAGLIASRANGRNGDHASRGRRARRAGGVGRRRRQGPSIRDLHDRRVHRHGQEPSGADPLGRPCHRSQGRDGRAGRHRCRATRRPREGQPRARDGGGGWRARMGGDRGRGVGATVRRAHRMEPWRARRALGDGPSAACRRAKAGPSSWSATSGRSCASAGTTSRSSSRAGSSQGVSSFAARRCSDSPSRVETRRRPWWLPPPRIGRDGAGSASSGVGSQRRAAPRRSPTAIRPRRGARHVRGAARGEFVLMRTPFDVPIVRFAITVMPTTPVAEGAAPERFYLATGAGTFVVTMPEDAWSHPGEAYDIPLAEPLRPRAWPSSWTMPSRKASRTRWSRWPS